MIKTELEEQTEQASVDVPWVRLNQSQYIVAAVVVIGSVIAILGFIIANFNNSRVPLPKTNDSYQNVGALPLSSATSSEVTPVKSDQNSYNQAGSNSGQLGGSYTGLQNVPQGQGSATPNSLQQTGQSLSTGQIINPNLPY